MWGFSLEALYPYMERAARIAAILLITLTVSRIANRSLKRLRGRFIATMLERAGAAPRELEIDKRAATINTVFRKTLTGVLWTAALIMSLREAGFDVAPLIAGAGIAGLAIGFGAQNLVRDIISGVFLLLENRIRIDDVIEVNGKLGKVDEINLRTVVLRGHDGTIHVFRNGAINSFSNLTWKHSYAVLNIRIGQKEDPDRVAEVLKQIGDELRAEEPFSSAVLEPLEVVGVEQLTDFGYIMQARFKTLPMEQFAIAREMNRRIRKRFTDLGIELK